MHYLYFSISFLVFVPEYMPGLLRFTTLEGLIAELCHCIFLYLYFLSYFYIASLWGIGSNLTEGSIPLRYQGKPPHREAPWLAYKQGSLQSWISNLQSSDCDEDIPGY